MPVVKHLFADISGEPAEESCMPILLTEEIRIERIVSKGHASPPGFWYDQETEEWVLLVKGGARLRFADGREVVLMPGDHLLIPSHCRHRVEWTDPEKETVWLAVHFRGNPSVPQQG